jgi:hypothetical protein
VPGCNEVCCKSLAGNMLAIKCDASHHSYKVQKKLSTWYDVFNNMPLS